MHYLILAAIGLVMGFFGGLLGLGGSIIMIPALVFAFGENQHLYQGAAMICNFFVGGAAALVHRSENMLMVDVLKWLVPSAAVGKLVGAMISNSEVLPGVIVIFWREFSDGFWSMWLFTIALDLVKVAEGLTVLIFPVCGIPGF